MLTEHGVTRLGYGTSYLLVVVACGLCLAAGLLQLRVLPPSLHYFTPIPETSSTALLTRDSASYHLVFHSVLALIKLFIFRLCQGRSKYEVTETEEIPPGTDLKEV
jgi:hypothetical protein